MGTNSIRDTAAAQQIVLFDGLPFVGSCSMSNVDARMAIRAMKRMMVVEVGHMNKVFGNGQRFAMEDDVNAYVSMGWTAIAVLTVHDTTIEEPVLLKDTLVKEVYWGGNRRDSWPGYETFGSLFERFWQITRCKQA